MAYPVPAQRLRRRDDGAETLERLKRWPSLKEKFKGKYVHIVSGQWGCFWGPDGSGYTDKKADAGIYTFEDAWSRTYHCGPEKRIRFAVAEAEYQI